MSNLIKFSVTTMLSFIFFISVLTYQPNGFKTVELTNFTPIESFNESEDIFYSNNLLYRFTRQDIQCLQANIFFEARNQTNIGKIAVAQVTLNRVKSINYPNTVCEVVTAGKRHNGKMVKHMCAFSWYCDGLSDRPNLKNKIEHEKWSVAYNIAISMLSGEITLDNEATHYHTVSSNPYWSNHPSMRKLITIGDHIFYKENLNTI